MIIIINLSNTIKSRQTKTKSNNMKTLIIYESVYHHSSEMIAKTIGEVLHAQLMKAKDTDPVVLNDYDLIGFGSGIYNQRHHSSLFDLLNKLTVQDHKKAFVFSTNTFGIKLLHKPLNEQLALKGFEVIGEYACRGYFSLFNIITINKSRPNADDVQKAKDFAKLLM